MPVVGTGLLVVAWAGVAYALFAWDTLRRAARAVPAAPAVPEPVSLLKPLHGAEPRLHANLRTFCRQDWPAPVQLVAGVGRADDAALAALAGLPGPACVVVDDRTHGPNAKVGNLVNMAAAAEHELLVLSDSDMAVPPDYLARIAAALAAPGVGAVTCLYRGRGDAGGWSVLGAAGVSYQFLPAVLVGLRLGLARPCMGSTIALRRATLDRIGGFAAFADVLADDHAVGAAVRALGLRVAVPSLLLVHAGAERSLAELWHHELRWAVTVRRLDPWGHLGTLVTFPIPWAALVLCFRPWAGAATLAAALVARWLVMRAVDRLAGARSAPRWWLPARDLLGLVVVVASFATGTVRWRGARLPTGVDGRLTGARA